MLVKLTSHVDRVGTPLLGDDLEHAGLGRLRRDEEPERGGEVEPGGGHEAGLLQQHRGVPVQRQREQAVVVVPGELLGAPAVIFLTFSTDNNKYGISTYLF